MDAHIPTLRNLVRKRWCKSAHASYATSVNQFDTIDTSKEREMRSSLCPNPGSSGYTCSGVRMWRTLVPVVVQAMHALGVWAPWAGDPEGNGMSLYTFGVFFGDSLYFFRHEFPKATLLGFDSFTGLPAEKPGEVARRGWVPGTFNTHLPRLVIQRLHEDLGTWPLPSQRTFFKRGFFNVSLTPTLAAKLPKAAIVDVDSDIYVSAYQALDWVFANQLAAVGTLIVYDDWMDYACGPRINRTMAEIGNDPRTQRRWANGRPTADKLRLDRSLKEAVAAGRFGELFSAGEPKAHLEIARKYQVAFRCLAGSCGRLARVHTADRAGDGHGSSRHAGGMRRQRVQERCDIHSPFGAVFVVTAIGGQGEGSAARQPFADSGGVENNEPGELAAWRMQNRGCQLVMRDKFTTTDA